MEKEVLRHRNETVVTPVVARIAKSLFERALEVAGQSRFDEIDDDVAMEIDDVQTHHSDPKNMQWGERVFEDKFYDTVIMDGVVYSVSVLLPT
jgi:DNA (cytosine-5)-methyltransferase 1